MNRRTILAAGAAASALSLLSFLLTALGHDLNNAKAPPGRRRRPCRPPRTAPHHPARHTRVDDYHWIRRNWQNVMRDPSVLKPEIPRTRAEKRLSRAMMGSTGALQESFIAKCAGVRRKTIPACRRQMTVDYYRPLQYGAQYPLYVSKPRGSRDGDDPADVDSMRRAAIFPRARGGTFARHALLAYTVRHGSEIYTLYVKDLATGQCSQARLPIAFGDFVWSPDSAFIFWTIATNNGRPDQIFRRPRAPAPTLWFYHETDDGMFISTDVSESREFILISIGNQETRFRIIRADPDRRAEVFHPRQSSSLHADALERSMARAHQCRQRHRLQSDDFAADQPGARIGRSLPHQPGATSPNWARQEFLSG